MTTLDLFAGTGAFSTIFEKIGYKCVFANDLCDASKEFYNLNHDLKLTHKDFTYCKC